MKRQTSPDYSGCADSNTHN